MKRYTTLQKFRDISLCIVVGLAIALLLCAAGYGLLSVLADIIRGIVR